jgi:phosphocarrier protein HPr
MVSGPKAAFGRPGKPRQGRQINAKSLAGVMMLAAGNGTRIVPEADGLAETEAADAIVASIASGLGNEE